MPSEDFITEKVESIKERFVFAESIMDTVDAISGSLSSGSARAAAAPPVIEINLGAANSKYDYGSTAIALDLTWFAKYKPMTDAVISAILWAFFIWRVFVMLPGIINGSTGVVGFSLVTWNSGVIRPDTPLIEKKGGKR